ncbi:DUF3800 domain-containing protein [Candidatus Poriferisocius sp.]|uniref:DUF3800 domain-containing protein n=1 Tax=Candidatus Poriferisocius sp. TaxID=3101276 RepID=UPI003B013150
MSLLLCRQSRTCPASGGARTRRRDWCICASLTSLEHTVEVLSDVPMFADSRASRALQAADLVACALYRYYSKPRGRRDERYVRRLWSQFDVDNGRMRGLIHGSAYFKRCQCPACVSRRQA